MPGCSVQRWSLSLGRWWGVPVYLHIFFLLSALLALAFTLPEPDLVSAGLMMVGVLLWLVSLLHEVGHSLAAIRVGGKVDAVVLGPVGGLISPRVPDEPEIHLFVALAGPIVHLLLAVVGRDRAGRGRQHATSRAIESIGHAAGFDRAGQHRGSSPPRSRCGSIGF